MTDVCTTYLPHQGNEGFTHHDLARSSYSIQIRNNCITKCIKYMYVAGHSKRIHAMGYQSDQFVEKMGLSRVTTHVIGQLQLNGLLTIHYEGYKGPTKSKKKAIEFTLIIGGADFISRLQLFQIQLFKISQVAVRFDYFKLKYRSLQ